MDSNPVYTFEMKAVKTGLMAIFSGKSFMGIHDRGISWQEGSQKKFVEYTKISMMKYSKYYSTISIVHAAFGPSETKKITLLDIAGFERTWTNFSRQRQLKIPFKTE